MQSIRIIHVRPIEHRWVANIIRAARKDEYLRNSILGLSKSRSYPCVDTKKFPEIDEDGHSGGSFSWSCSLAREALIGQAKIRKHKDGIGYLPFQSIKE